MGQQWGPGWRICPTFISFIFISKISPDICAVPLTRGSTKRAGTFLAPESPKTPLGPCWDPARTPLGPRWDPHSSPCPWGRASAGLVVAERAARAGLSCAWFGDDGSHGELASGLASPKMATSGWQGPLGFTLGFTLGSCHCLSMGRITFPQGHGTQAMQGQSCPPCERPAPPGRWRAACG